jgi:RNA polymerase sigma factor (sigma-70 family)
MFNTMDFDEAYARYWPVVRAMLSRKDPTIAEDLAQEVFIKAMLSDHPPKGSVKSWLYAITRRAYGEYVRNMGRQRRAVHTAPREGTAALEEIPSPCGTPENAVIADNFACITSYNTNTDGDGATVMAYLEHGYLITEIAEKTGLSRAQVTRRVTALRESFYQLQQGVEAT